MSAPITEAHREAAVAIFAIAMKSSHHGAPFREPCAQLIADSEAKAVVEIAMVAAASADFNVSLRLERDQLRAENATLRAAQKACEDCDAPTTAEVAGLRADCTYNHECINRLASATGKFGEKSETVVEVALSTIDQLRAEVEQLKADGAASAFINMSCRASRAEAELAAERARLDWLEDHGWVTGEPCDRAGIDAAMKEGA